MELSKLVEKFKTIIEVNDINGASSELLRKVVDNRLEMYDKWVLEVGELENDTLQPIFQYYYADRKNKMQDYTPKSLARLTCMIAGIEKGGKVYDMCSGSGALTIQAWVINPECTFICQEFDERVIPFLLFNLCVRNIQAVVIHGDVLLEEQFKIYKVEKGEKYSKVTETSECVDISADFCISNPPYNMKFKLPDFPSWNERYKYGVPAESNANYAFILAAIQAAGSSALILPNSVLDTKTNSEFAIRETLITSNLIESVVLNPENMFECTSIGTCVLVLKKVKETASIMMIDARKNCQQEKRLQKGQYGGASHQNRLYEKNINVYENSNILKILTAIENKEAIPEFSHNASITEIKSLNYSLSPTKYIEFIPFDSVHRAYAEIVDDINRVKNEKNSCKLVINETLAKALGFDVSLYKSDLVEDNNPLLEKISGKKILKNDYIQFTKNKGEFTFKANNPEHLSTIFVSVVQMWKQHMMFLNEQENVYLCELRDALLPDLMNGKIEV